MTEILETFRKSPTAKLDYRIDWSSALGSDTIATSAWNVPAGLTGSGSANTTVTSTIFLEGGTSGKRYLVTCTITTAGGRTDTRTIQIEIGARDGMTTLIQQLRSATNTTPDDYTLAGDAHWTDVQLQDALDRQSQLWRSVRLNTAPTKVGGAYEYYDYVVPVEMAGSFEEYAADSGWCVRDSAGGSISASNYSVNYPARRITFSANTHGSILYLDARSYNVNAAAAEMWRRKASIAANKVSWSSDNHKVEASQEYAQCIRMSEYYEAQSGSRAGRFVRTDEV